jgi:hypothetical protein
MESSPAGADRRAPPQRVVRAALGARDAPRVLIRPRAAASVGGASMRYAFLPPTRTP